MEFLNLHYNGVCPIEKGIRCITLNEPESRTCENDKLILEDLKQQRFQLGSTFNIDELSRCKEEESNRSQALHDGCLLKNHSCKGKLHSSIFDEDRKNGNENIITMKEKDPVMSLSLVCDSQFESKEVLSIDTLEDKKYSSYIDSSDAYEENTCEENNCCESYSVKFNESNEINAHKFTSIHPLMFSVQTNSNETINFQDLQNLRRENGVLQQVTSKYKQMAMNAESELRKLKAKINSHALNQAIDTKGKENLLTNRYHPYHKNASRRLS